MLRVLVLICCLYRPATGAETPPETETVEATGVGKTVEDAEKNALINAVQKVVGAYVDAEILVKNEDIIHDQILSASSGFITSLEVKIKPHKRRTDDLFETTIKAVVQKGKVAEHLRKTKIPLIVASVDGNELWAEAVTGGKKVEDGRKLLAKYFSEMPANFLKARLLNAKGATGAEAARPKIKRDDATGKIWCAWNIEVSCDRELYYSEQAPKLQKILEVVSERRGAEPIRLKTALKYRGQTGSFQIATPLTAKPLRWWPFPIVEEPLRIARTDQDSIVLLNTKSDSSQQNQEFHWYVLKKESYGTLLANAFGGWHHGNTPIHLEIRFLHIDESLIAEEKIPVNQGLLSEIDGSPTSHIARNVSHRMPLENALPYRIAGGPLGTLAPLYGLFRDVPRRAPLTPPGTIPSGGPIPSIDWNRTDCVLLAPEFRLEGVQFIEANFAQPEGTALSDSVILHYERALDVEDLKDLKEVQLRFVNAEQ